jgi:hypothetical protein
LQHKWQDLGPHQLGKPHPDPCYSIGMQIRNTGFKGPTGQVSQPESGTNGCELIRALVGVTALLWIFSLDMRTINKFNIAAAFSLSTSKARFWREAL